MMKKDIMALIGTPVRAMRHVEPMVPMTFKKWGPRISCTSIPNRDYNIVDMEFRGEDDRGEDVSFNVVLKTPYTDDQLWRQIRRSASMYVLNMKLYLVDDCGNIKLIPNTRVTEYGHGYDPGSHYRRLHVNGVVCPPRKYR